MLHWRSGGKPPLGVVCAAAPSYRDPCRRRRRLQPADGPRRSRHAVARSSRIARELIDAKIAEHQRPHRQADRRRDAGRVPERGQRGRLRGRDSARHGRPQRERACRPAHRVSHRDQSRRRDRRGRRSYSATASTSRRGWRRSPKPGGIAISLHCSRPRRRAAEPSLRGHRRAGAQEHRPAGSRLSGRLGRRAPVSRAAAPAAPNPCRAEQAVDRRPAVHQHERRSRTGIFRRRAGRGRDHQSVEDPRPVRHRPEFDLRLQGQGRGHPQGRQGAWRPLRAGGQRPEGGEPAAHHRPAHRGDRRDARLGRQVRRRGRRHLRSAGPADGEHRRRDRAVAPAGRDRAGAAQAARECSTPTTSTSGAAACLCKHADGTWRRRCGSSTKRCGSIRTIAAAHAYAAWCHEQRFFRGGFRSGGPRRGAASMPPWRSAWARTIRRR